MSDLKPILERIREDLGKQSSTDTYERFLAYRRRSATRRRIAAFVVGILVATVGMVGILSIFPRGNIPVSTPQDQPTSTEPEPTASATPGGDGAAEVLAGVPYPVCRPFSIPGDFGDDAGGRVFVFDEAPEQGCDAGYEGFQRIGVAPDGHTVTLVSERLTQCLDSSGCWPFATPDLDMDGIDEIALGIGWVPDLTSVAIYRVGAPPATETGDPRPRPMRVVCDDMRTATCVDSPSVFEWGRAGHRAGGAYCALVAAGEGVEGAGLVVWISTDGDGWDEVSLWVRGDELVEVGGGRLVTHGLPYDQPWYEEARLCDTPVYTLDQLDPE